MSRPLQLGATNLHNGIYPEQTDKESHPFDQFVLRTYRSVRGTMLPPLPYYLKVAGSAVNMAAEVNKLNDAALRSTLLDIAKNVARAPRHRDLPKALALVREAAKRSLGVFPYPTQLLGAAVLLEGRLAEMRTGEGKTLTAALAACLAGVAGLPTHVVTVNDYLARRDAENMGPLLRFFDLSVGVVVSGMSHENKRAAYQCHITYCTNKELVFDYLRDKVAAGGCASQFGLRVRALHGKSMQPLLLRGLHFAIVDETDSILIDEARTPLILSAKTDVPADPGIYQQAIHMANRLREGLHYQINLGHRELHLTETGKAELADQVKSLGAGIWQVSKAREHLIAQALRALHLFNRDFHYLVADDKVHIIDEFTGRILPGRKWEQDLHQMIEVKEGCPLSEPVKTLARITYQRFFCRYLRLSGMTGTAREVGGELQRTYGLEMVAIPTHKPCLRKILPGIFCADEIEKWRQVTDFTMKLQGQGRPVLIGTRSVLASEKLSLMFVQAGIKHRVLNARQDAEEADVIARAGEPGAVTVATNMAGRGTDIRMDAVMVSRGGLTVIVTEFHESARIDRQLIGRCARQGDAGGVDLYCGLYRSIICWAWRLVI